MIEVALLLGLGAVGYLLAKDQTHASYEAVEQFTMAPRPNEETGDGPVVSQAQTGHANMVPFFGARVTQSMYSGANDQVLDNHTGAGKEYFQKREVKSFFDAKPGDSNPFGNPDESDFMQSRMVSGQSMKNVFPIEQVRVGPGADDGYTNIPKGGFQQDQLREFTLPKTTDEIRVIGKEKLSYEPPVVPGAHYVTVSGIQAAVTKNKPDKFAILGMDRVNTAVGAQTAPTIYAEQPYKPQNRETTEREYIGSAGGSIAILAPYVRAFTEPYQEFMRLTAEGRPGPAGGSSGMAIGADSYSVESSRNEQAIIDAARFNGGANVVSSAASVAQLGSYRYNEPLKENAQVERIDPLYTKALASNPYAKPPNSY
ncbi:MAG: hypothetical protein EB127_07715 [Alphaproteobacteria bacterium]|nr:hypothetical protein [Alphaproteobacteria bacterium]